MPLFNKKKELTDNYLIERTFDRGTYRLAHRKQREDHGSGREATKETNLRSEYCRILSKRKASMFWVQIRGRHLCPLIAYLGVLIEFYKTKDLMMQK